ncbi:MAG TPA: carboxypeptidase regulatory-like domain-containing protein [Vicinamibacterales bacterium]|nr:carboxypeptidase regulatory-like domain-containing protein [Vicinamibacterales bacterium]
MRGLKSVLLALAMVVGVPLAAFAQASLAGQVKDTSGAVLPGVTVEASSPVLIEKTRTAITDGSGRYSILDLRPGTYRVSFTLPGFKTIVREGVELSGTLVVNINADMTIGGVQETITVSGETPVVNLQSTTRQAVMDQEVVSAIPSSRTPFTVGVLIPGVRKGAFTGQDVGGSVVQEVASLEANGGRTSDQRMMVNGVALSSGIAGGWGGGAVPNATGTAEFAIDVSGVDAQAATGGVRINFIPRDGGNRFSGTVAANFANQDFASDNFTGSDVQQRGLAVPGTIKANGDFNPGFGGPIKQDKVWFFLSGRSLFADNYVASTFFNANANNLNRFDYVRSPNQAILHQEQTIYQARLTWQVSPKHKVGMTFDQEKFCACTTGIGPGPGGTVTSPEAGNDRRFPLQRFVTVDWNTPVSNRLLVEASGIHRVERWGGMEPQVGKLGNIDHLEPGMISVTDSLNPVTGTPLTYRAATTYNNSWNWNIHYRAAVSYITGSNTFKVGFNNAFLHHDNTTYSAPAAPISYNFNGMVPAAIQYRIVPRTVKVDVNRDLGLFVQDKWTTGRWTLSGAVRFDSFKNSFPEQTIAGTYFGRTLNVHYDKIDNLSWNDVTPRLGLTYDVFGNGKTALKVTLNKYLEGLGTTGAFFVAQVSDAPNPINRLLNSTQRVWSDANSNFVPDCDLNNFAANGECLALDNGAIFGTVTPGTSYDPDLLTGWGKRSFNWEFTTSVQQEIIPRMSVEVQYARRWYGNIRVTDDLSASPSDYTAFPFTAPADSRLPNGGGYALTGMSLSPTVAANSYFVTLSNNYGKQTEHFDGLNVTVNARLQNGLLLQGGLGTGRQVLNDCEVVDDLPEMLHTFFGDPTRAFFFAARPREFCEQNRGFRTSVQGLAAYTIPKIDLQISGTLQNLPGALVESNANYGVIPGVAGFGPFIPFKAFNIVAPGELFVERLNQLDFRVSKILRFGGTRTNINFDFYNVLNANSVIGENFAYGPTWRQPTSILIPRLFKIGAQFDF